MALHRLLFVLIFLMATLIPPAQAENVVTRQAAQIIQSGEPLTPSTITQLQNSADGRFLLAGLYEFGSYGVPLNGEKAFALYQRAAEAGQMQAALYCWDRCLVKTPAIIQAIADAAAADDADGLLLYARHHASLGNLAEADQYLLRAAKAGQWQAIAELYIQHFIDWSANETSQAPAEAKLKRCLNEGVVSCQLLLGAFYQRHGYSDKALLHYLQLVQLDYPLSRTYLYAEQMEGLLARMPVDSLVILQSQVATDLLHLARQGLEPYQAFMACDHQATYACVRKVVKRDAACRLNSLNRASQLQFRQTSVYQQCLNQ